MDKRANEHDPDVYFNGSGTGVVAVGYRKATARKDLKKSLRRSRS